MKWIRIRNPAFKPADNYGTYRIWQGDGKIPDLDFIQTTDVNPNPIWSDADFQHCLEGRMVS